YEATDFLLHPRSIDPCTALVLWQVGAVGERFGEPGSSRRGWTILAAALSELYEPGHEVVLYEASPYRVAGPIIRRLSIRDLPTEDPRPMSTMLILPASPPAADPEMYERLGIPMSRGSQGPAAPAPAEAGGRHR